MSLFSLSGPQLVLGHPAVSILVLVVEHVPDDTVGVDPWTETTFPLLHLKLDES